MTKNNTLITALLVGGVAVAGYHFFMSQNNQQIVGGGAGAGVSGVGAVTEGEMLTGVSDSQAGLSESEMRVLRDIETFNLTQAQDGFRIIQGSGGTQIIVSERDSELVDSVARSSTRQGDFSGQVTVTDESGRAERVLDFDTLTSRSAEGGYSKVGGGVGFAEPEERLFSPAPESWFSGGGF